MKIHIWSDFMCPFCYIGKRKLEQAISQFDFKETEEVEIVFHSFELNPMAEKNNKRNIHELVAQKYNISLERAQAANTQIVEQAELVNLPFNYDHVIPTNTFDAHRLTYYAKAHGKMAALTERLLKAYFIDCLNLSDEEVLSNLAGEVGLDRNQALTVLQSDRYAQEVRADEEIASQLNMTGVPYFVFNDQYAISGAQPTELFLDVLKRVSEEERVLRPKKQASKVKTEFCTDGACHL